MLKQFAPLREKLLRAGVAPRHVRRYLKELEEHLADLRAEEVSAGSAPAAAEAAAMARLGSTEELVRAMVEQPGMKSWAARAPWAVFGAGPVALMFAAQVVALLILWSGWVMLLPNAATPFGVHVQRGQLAWVYFGVGRMIYFGAPVAAGWAMAWVAVRQRTAWLWPLAGMAVVAVLGAMVVVHANMPGGPGAARSVGLGIAMAPMLRGEPFIVGHALVILMLSALPYLAWAGWERREQRA